VCHRKGVESLLLGKEGGVGSDQRARDLGQCVYVCSYVYVHVYVCARLLCLLSRAHSR